MDRPLLLIDVDGVISLFGFDHAAPPAGRYELVDGIAHFLSGSAGEHLRRLAPAFELAWCTGWEEKANDYLPLALGLDGPLPHVVFDPAERPSTPIGSSERSTATSSRVGRSPGSTTPTTSAVARGRPPARRRRCWSRPTRPIGLTDRDVERLLSWATRPR